MTEAVKTIQPSRLSQEIAQEQAVVDRVYSRLDAAVESARQLAADGHARARLGNETGFVERDAIVFQAGRRLAMLNAAHEGLVFGRLDLTSTETRYIGRLGLRDADRESLLVDWRAPAAAVFYQATPEDPHGVVRRRVLRSRLQTVLGVEDELLDAAHAPDDMVVIGEGALMAALSRARDGQMQSVVATIQREQDLAVRAPARGVTSITGGPGTGKTVVALHRVAYLLYTDRRRYEHGGVLVVGPNAVFMAYIERVLPSLGETAVSLRAIGEVVEGVTATRHDPPEVTVVKGSERMQRVLARTVRGPVPTAPTSFRIFYRDDVLRLDERALGRVRRNLMQGATRRNRALVRVFDELAGPLWEQASGSRAREQGRDEFVRWLRDSREFVEFCRTWWPRLDGVDVLGWLADPVRLARDAAGALNSDEIRSVSASLAGIVEQGLSVEDVPLVDELRYLLGESVDPFGDDDEDDPLSDLVDEQVHELATSFERLERAAPPGAGTGNGTGNGTGTGRPTTSIEDDAYAHVLVDEAQDLTPMQWRMLGRRGRGATWTIVGDPAQSSWPLGAQAAAARDAALHDKDRHEFRLTTNYRNSSEIFELAAQYARTRIPTADVPVAVRSTGMVPTIHQVAPHERAAAVRSAVRDAYERLHGTSTLPDAGAVGGDASTEAVPSGGTIAVVAPDSMLADVRDWLTGYLGEGSEIRLLAPVDTKGLEFDSVVLVEPDQIVDGSASGFRTLYVVLTRATRLLAVVQTSGRWRQAQ